jgi:membrane protein
VKFARALIRAIKDFFAGDGIILASSMSFFFIMSIVPFSIFLLSLIGYFLGEHEGFYRFFAAKITFFFPSGTERAALQIKKLIRYKSIGNLSLLLYAFLSLGLFMTLQKSMQVTFKVAKSRNFLVSLFISVLTVTAIALLAIGTFILYNLEPVLRFFGDQVEFLNLGWFFLVLFKNIIPFSLVLGTVFALYILLPARRVRPGDAFRGALFTALMFEVAKRLFTLYIRKVTLIGAIYGPLSAFIFFLLWVFYASCIFLIGAGLVSQSGQMKGVRR